ncbi:MAG: ArsA family ATPase [Chloroflexota bacterium]
MFGGKGGVGKTTCAAATALHHASLGEETIIISTDFTPSLKDIFDIDSSTKPTKVAERLYAAEIGYEEVKKLWDEKFGKEVYDVFSAFVDIGYEEFVDFVATILPGIRDEFMIDYVRELAESGRFKKIIWDTAPAGQTLGLLQMPSLINKHLNPAPRIYSALKTTRQRRSSVLGIIKRWAELSSKDIEFLKSAVAFNLVTIAEGLSVRQLDDIIMEFRKYSFNIENIIVNQVVKEPDSDFLRSRASMQHGYLLEIEGKYGVSVTTLPLFSHEIKGIEKLREVERVLYSSR